MKSLLQKFLIIIAIMAVITGKSESQVKVLIDATARADVKQALTSKFGEQHKFRIERGVEQAANFWFVEDGSAEEFKKFCMDNFASEDKDIFELFRKFENYNELMSGYYNELILDLKKTLDLDIGDIKPVDAIMGAYDPSAHLTEDLFKNKYAFLVLLNFPTYSLGEYSNEGKGWNRLQWAYARMGKRFTTRIPANLNQKINDEFTRSGQYISDYNIMMGNLVDDKMNRYFPEGMKLISHWGLRDELKSKYSNSADIEKQKMIYKVMERIVRQEIPQIVINNPTVLWNPYSNKVYQNGSEIPALPEPNTRYEMLLNIYKAEKLIDPYFPELNTHILRSCNADREILEKETTDIFEKLLTSSEVKKVAGLIENRLGRKLQPFDIWYDGFKSRGSIDEKELDRIVGQKYPTPEAFEKDIVNILMKLGFPENDAVYISDKIQVDPARGSGHAAQSTMKKFKARLRTRVQQTGMNYKGYNIAVHELGHNVEQTLTLYKMDYYSLIGVPNTAFTEALAFVFQGRDLELLGMKDANEKAKDLSTIDIFWSAYEIMGVSLVDLRVWHWMYDNPGATPEQLKKAVNEIAAEIWNKYYAPVFGVKDQVILGIYSHMIDNALYLPNYSLGHIIQFQIEDYLKDKVLGTEMQRMCASGSIIPQEWMKKAVGSEISVKSLIEAVEKALINVK